MANKSSSTAIVFLAFLLLAGSAYAQDNFDIWNQCAPECEDSSGICITCIVAGWGCPTGCVEWVYGPSLCNCIPERYYPRLDSASP
ncbi:uncharacterized protein [Medicago truncatula]|nr:uncharacterized protein LOC25495687 [Medicago truncatula]KEH25409.1 transmembrane protein, putative [Medicago truncatula]